MNSVTTVGSPWDIMEELPHINVLELYAVQLALTHLAAHCQLHSSVLYQQNGGGGGGGGGWGGGGGYTFPELHQSYTGHLGLGYFSKHMAFCSVYPR